MKVAKFGGSSLSSSNQLKKVSKIIKNDPDIGAVVVSAPGRRFEDDIKVTDLLIALHANKITGLPYNEALDAILSRYEEIITGLGIGLEMLEKFRETILSYLQNITDNDRLLDALKSCGEDFNAQMLAEYLTLEGTAAKYYSPEDAGIYVTDEASNAQLLDESYDNIARLKDSEEVIVIPGFFGLSKNGNIVTFPRGGSDISGAIVARGLDAEIYENYTDQSHIYSAHPGFIENPHAIEELTYREMRELSYSGFGIFHDEALEPLYQVEIPVMIKNTNEPHIEGTKIVSKRALLKDIPVIGISCDVGFTAISVKDYLMNRQVGYMRKLLQIFENHRVSVEHMPSGIDNISIIARSKNLDGSKTEQVTEDINDQLEPEKVETEENLALLVIVGEGMEYTVGLANKATKALTENGINIRMMNQGASESSMVFAVKMSDYKKALSAVYNEYFRNID
ncbi:aspartate kinase [Lacicoccus alkaliphilus]|uniref:Aspartokinase n=1 Tax=Lacicoccus alkaliphilus DSM 16010 TaxID=1123231 RepID=A0A1M7BQY8_9BACL|nr:aspartate kinase [Salinicoccus alkaliphilus]SHL57401.1 aspartate kinase [Salinicoccus alkaliphilus DSM 16010]